MLKQLYRELSAKLRDYFSAEDDNELFSFARDLLFTALRRSKNPFGFTK